MRRNMPRVPGAIGTLLSAASAIQITAQVLAQSRATPMRPPNVNLSSAVVRLSRGCYTGEERPYVTLFVGMHTRIRSSLQKLTPVLAVCVCMCVVPLRKEPDGRATVATMAIGSGDPEPDECAEPVASLQCRVQTTYVTVRAAACMHACICMCIACVCVCAVDT